MPCDAIATVRADIKNLERLLTPENVKEAILRYLMQEGYPHIRTTTGRNTFHIYTNRITVYIKGAEVVVSGPEKSLNMLMAQNLANKLKETAGILMQKKVLIEIRNLARVTSTTLAPKKALVIRAKI